jgi:hypothetical protein
MPRKPRSLLTSGFYIGDHALVAFLVLHSSICFGAVWLVNFGAPRVVNLNDGPYAVATGDFNGDGRFDFASFNTSFGAVSVVLSGSGHQFSLSSNYTVRPPDYFHVGIATADVNGDQAIDIIAATGEQKTIAVLLGNGDGTFSLRGQFNTGETASSLAIGDFNRDNKPDVATANYYAGSVSILLGGGDGTFTLARTVPSGRGLSIAVGDFDKDQKADLAVALDLDSAVAILFGKANGTFEAPIVYPLGLHASAPQYVATADLNGDGHLDLVTALKLNFGIAVQFGNRHGTFSSPVIYVTGGYPSWLALADLNGDRHVDIVVANWVDASLGLLLGDGTGTFLPQPNIPLTGRGYSVAAGDFNGDGKVDLVAGTISLLSADVLLNETPSIAPLLRMSKPDSDSIHILIAARVPGEYVLECSDDLTKWKRCATIHMDSAGPATVIQPIPAGQLFFRCALQP